MKDILSFIKENKREFIIELFGGLCVAASMMVWYMLIVLFA